MIDSLLFNIEMIIILQSCMIHSVGGCYNNDLYVTLPAPHSNILNND